ncbi:hyperosmolality-gated Ca2+ permeable channel 2.3 [Nicotiana tabacum]|uniref:Hyperosmolality-gated Ca2+ permeable channel 2.3 n=5 Tax=Nicotiana TaxID=4085 RepID=A0AC58UAM8_TOBAC|nr:PREDICTED: CSC1-like protein HYP1 isoform X1 [Nicotiana sylvestris]XP_009789224.1 PREDICTED: CSC1-like protein HYP1 isoform X1 [Nicotiana sylvestris]XP_009789226.1 PREDICTED: CSC1-like protein HYP1 isoform X1 [Nicotiana sylvestris]XP_009789227.1 PREDICTED: CSC1-like protein HYP1 isoform X1 [Nicotiana sylvestris]
MILSALLTSVGINLGLCFLFFTLYSILRKQPGNAEVYAPRLVAEGKSQQTNDFNLERLLPSAGWVTRAWKLSEAELLSASGLDGVVFMRIFIFSARVFAFAVVVGVFILLPINYMGKQLSLDIFDLPNKSLESFTISNVDDGSNRLWIHFSAVYIFTAVVCYLLYFEYDYISSKRVSYFYSSKPHPHQFTILVRSIPVSSGRSYSETVESFFTEYYPTTYLSHWVVRRASKLQGLIKNADKLRRLVRLKSANPNQERSRRAGFMGLFGHRVDLLDHYEKKLEDIEENVRAEQSSTLGKEVGAAFVSFRTRFAAAAAIHMQQGVNPTQWVSEPAPDPEDVYWPFFSASFLKRWISNLVVIVACVLITVLFLIPVLIVQGLTHLEQLETWFPFLKGLLRIAFVSQVITGYLPSLVLQLFLYLVPSIMIMLSSIQGYIALSQIEKSACIKVLWFTIWNIFFANVLSGTALYRAEIFLEPKKIPAVLAVAVPGQATFFIAYVVTSGWTSTSSELFRLTTLIFNFIKRNICRKFDDEFEVPSVPYHSEIPRILLFGLLGITYFFLAPLILPFLLVYYCLGYLIYRNQLLNVYAPKYETGGKLWPIVHDSMIFSLILMHVIAIGIFGLKKLPLASSLIVPLPILTLVFNSYCRRRFLPMFKSYSVESLLKKDREEQNDPTMASFHDRLATAYQDPALMRARYSGNSESINAPLLRTSEADT